MTDSPTDSVLVVLARLEGKVDANLAAHGTDINGLKLGRDDHEIRLRALEGQPVCDPERVRALEDRRTVSPGQLWAGLIGVAALGATSLTVINGVIDVLNN